MKVQVHNGAFLIIILLLTAKNLRADDGETLPKSESRINAQYSITSKDDRAEEILSVAPQRPYTPVSSNKNRVLYPVRIKLGETPCSYEKFMYFFNEAKDRDVIPFNLLMNATVTFRGQDYYFYDAEDLCISVDDELNVDIWQFDCTPSDICACGLYFGYVDIDIPPRIEHRQLHYFEVNGLDRKLVTENGECKSGLKGHCSMIDGNVSVKNPLRCASSYSCELDDTYGPIFKNEVTEQVYGICLPNKAEKVGTLQGRSLGAESVDGQDHPSPDGSASAVINFVNLYLLGICFLRTVNLQ